MNFLCCGVGVVDTGTSQQVKTDCSMNNFLNYFYPKYILFSVLLTSSFAFFLVVLSEVSVVKLALP